MNTGGNNKYNYTSYSKILSDLINEELSDTEVYKYMAENTENEKYSMLLMQLSSDENKHSQSLMREYYRLTGHNYRIKKTDLPDFESFKDFITDRIKAEINGFKTYSKLASSAPNRILETLYNDISMDETEHAFLLLMILTEMQS